MIKTFEALVASGEPLAFHGVDWHLFKLGVQVFEAEENPDDGYRSMLSDVIDVTGRVVAEARIFFRTRVATVKVVAVSEPEFEGYRLLDVEDGHCWLELGTNTSEDYYPCFVFCYSPKEKPASGRSKR